MTSKKRTRSTTPWHALVWLLLMLGPAHAMVKPPQPMPYVNAVATPQDRPFAGEILLEVDATDVPHRLFRVRQVIPVQSTGAVTLLYPEWEPASHARTVSAANLAGLVIRAGATRLAWRRDALDPHAFHIDVPDGATALEIEFQYVTRPADTAMRPDMVVLQWHKALLYPAGWFARNIPVRARARFPEGLMLTTALALDAVQGNVASFSPTSLETLSDTPVFASRYRRRIPIGVHGQSPVWLDLIPDAPDGLTVEPEHIAALRRMVAETSALFGPAPDRAFHAIVVLSDAFPVGGVEHAGSAEIWSGQLNNLDLIAHEYVHAWNGRARQPEDLWAPTLNVPVRNSLLWVYEGQTEFWGRVLAARSGMRTRAETLDKLALDAADVAARSGRAWKPLRDTVHDPLYMSGRSTVWPDWQRRKDYYTEGVLLWLDVDMTLRERSAGRVGLDDFARDFFDVGAHGTVETYSFEDLCAALTRLVPMDWAAYLDDRLDADAPVVQDGLARAGWSLAFSPNPSETFRQHEAELGASDLTHSVGMTVTQAGRVRSVAWEGPAFHAGLVPGATLLTVDGDAFSLDRLHAAIEAADATTLSLDYEVDGVRSTGVVDYRGGLRYPHLERLHHVPDRLSLLLDSTVRTRPGPTRQPLD
ncbi:MULTISPECIES: M61 family peptidase [Luteimonas]|uniref:M61 family metallopeptidase n=1 Tax=Luteimonas TaxID=83614 RepID=UPI00130463D4|nr:MULTISPECIES: M61 family peptidase [Luteimonas]